ncbi:MAG: amino acid permease [Theionarchaea archaeon]|nr:amino acid permease [Theionarchaea archaeon]
MTKTGLSWFDGWMLGTGSMIGAAIFVVSGVIIGTGGPSSFLSFLFAGLATLGVALCFSRLVEAFPQSSGGIYTYPKKVLKSDIVSFIAGWSLWGGQGLGPAIVGLSFAFYFSWLLRGLDVSVPISDTVLAILIIVILGIINCLGADLSRKTQMVTTFSILACLLIFIAGGVPRIDGENLSPFLPYGVKGLLRASAMASLTYGAWSTIPSASQEFQNPQKDVPLSMTLSIVTCAVLFSAVVFVQAGLVNHTILSEASAPLAEAASRITGDAGLLIGVAGLFATTSTLNGLIFTGSQLLKSMGRDALPSALGSTSRWGTPGVAILITVSGQIILVVTGLFLLIVEMTVFVTTISWIIGCVSAAALNHQTTRSIKGYIVPGFSLGFCTVLCSTLESMSLLLGMAWIGLGIVVYVLSFLTDTKRKESMTSSMIRHNT